MYSMEISQRLIVLGSTQVVLRKTCASVGMSELGLNATVSRVDLRSLSGGIYFVEIRTGSGSRIFNDRIVLIE